MSRIKRTKSHETIPGGKTSSFGSFIFCTIKKIAKIRTFYSKFAY